ncbi:MAG: hypothetical protein ACE5KA_06920, partial [Nitrososphaerales archaeon]
GYFQPDYGEIQPPEKEYEFIDVMIKRQDPVYSGMLYLPLIKLNLLDEEYEIDLDHVVANLKASIERTERWKECLKSIPSIISTRVRKSNTDPDMLGVLLGIKFDASVKLNKQSLLDALAPILDNLHEEELV